MKKSPRIMLVAGLQIGKKFLEALLLNSANVVAVFTLDREYANNVSGFIPFDDIAAKYNISQYIVRNINDADIVVKIRGTKPDIIFVIGWSQMLKKEVLEIPSVGVVGLHESLLPNRRGRAPIAWALIDGLTESGVTFFWMDDHADEGDILAQKSVKIDFDDNAQTLIAKCGQTSIELTHEFVPKLLQGVYPRIPQDHSKATYTHGRTPDMGLIDWEKNSLRLYNFIRGVTHPYPGAFTYHRLTKMHIWQASIADWSGHWGRPGQVIDRYPNNNYLLQAGDGTLLITLDKSIQLSKGDILG